MPVLVVFDLDGTLIDSVRDLALSASELAVGLGGRRLEESAVATMIGEGAPILIRRALQAAGLDPAIPGALEKFLEIYDRRLLDNTGIYPGLREALSIVGRRARLAVLTNKPLRPTEQLLETLQLAEYFDEVIGGDGVHGRKPHPAGLRSLIESHHAHAALFVGDSPIDWETAQAADCAFAWARYGFGAARFNDATPDTTYVLNEPRDLVQVVDRFAAVHSGA